jgi:hypothetical protein
MQVDVNGLKLIEKSVDEQLILDQNEEVHRLEQELRDLQEIFQEVLKLNGAQGETLEQVEKKTTAAEEAVEEAVGIQEEIAEDVKKSRIFTWISGGGALGGGLLGSLGFLINPPVGLVSVAALTALGFGTGHVAERQLKKGWKQS